MEVESSVREPDIKSFTAHLKARTDCVVQELYSAKQSYQLIRSESKAIEHTSNEACNDLTSNTLDALEGLEKEFKTLINEEKTETSFLKQQFISLNQEKMKLEQNVMMLESRVTEVERQVGLGITLPSIYSQRSN